MKKYFILNWFFYVIIFFSLFFTSFALPVLSKDNNQQNIIDINQSSSNIDFKEEILEGEVIRILKEEPILLPGMKEGQIYQKLEILVTKGSFKNKKIIVEGGNLAQINLPKYKIGDRLMIKYNKDATGKDIFYIVDYVRRPILFWLFLIFVIAVLTVSRWQGIVSLFGMGVSFLVIFSFILPKIAAGGNPVQIAISGSLIIIIITFLLSHGLNKKTVIAILGTLITLIITGILANIFVEAAKLTGFVAEEISFLQISKSGVINIKGLLLAGIIIGVLGVLDDITISQAAVVEQLKEANPKLKAEELYKKAMIVGKDHIASLINTLFLVYTGAALPLLLLFIDNPRSFSEIINYEIIADEIIRTLVGSVGLILAVPITTFIALLMTTERINFLSSKKSKKI